MIFDKFKKKPDPNHKIYIEALRNMTPEQRVRRTFELSDYVRGLFYQGLKQAFPELSEEELHKLYLKRLDKCHNRNW